MEGAVSQQERRSWDNISFWLLCYGLMQTMKTYSGSNTEMLAIGCHLGCELAVSVVDLVQLVY